MANTIAFSETRKCFLNNISYTAPLKFEEWVNIPDDQKAVYLFVQFYDSIVMAWHKANQFDFVESEEGVSTVMQYLEKQVNDIHLKGHPKKKVSHSYYIAHPKECEVKRRIEDNPSRFSSSYIYKIAYNCLYCICHDLVSVKDRWAYEVGSVVEYDGEHLDLFNIASINNTAVDNEIEYSAFESEFWKVVAPLGEKGQKAMRYLLSGDPSQLKKLGKKSRQYKADPLRDVEVSESELSEIISQLREAFLSLPQSSSCGQYLAQLGAC